MNRKSSSSTWRVWPWLMTCVIVSCSPALGADAVKEGPGRDSVDLLSIAADKNQPEARRREALLKFFKKAADGKQSLRDLWTERLGLWFDQEHLFDMTEASKVPVKRELGESVFMVRLVLSPNDNSAIYLRFSSRLRKDELLSAVRGSSLPAGVTLVEAAMVEAR